MSETTNNTNNPKILAAELRRRWNNLLAEKGVSKELSYRIEKLDNRLEPILDKMYLKTVKGQEMLKLCGEKTESVRTALLCGNDGMFRLLTDLEKTYEELLKKTYEFRIKAG